MRGGEKRGAGGVGREWGMPRVQGTEQKGGGDAREGAMGVPWVVGDGATGRRPGMQVAHDAG